MSFNYQPPAATDLEILYLDEDIIITNKPSGLLAVPGRGEDKQDCLISRINSVYKGTLIVHRLDMDTSGLIILARNKQTHRLLSDLFQSRKIKKKYIAVVDGWIEPSKGEIDLPLITDWPNRPKQKVDHEHGKPSQTFYTRLNKNTDENNSRLELVPITGRSHQLRVHMQSLGHPIVGDNLYNPNTVRNKTSRLLLHASYLEFVHPINDQLMTLSSKAPF